MDENVCYVNVQFAQLLLVCRAIGGAPVHLTRVNRGYMVTLSGNYAICNTIFVSFISAFLVIAQFLFIYFINDEREPSILSFIYTVTVFSDIFCKHFPLLTTIYNGRTRFSRLIKYLRKINEINAALDSEYISIKLKRAAVIFWLISTLISFVLFLLIIYYGEWSLVSNKYFVKLTFLLYYFNMFFVFIMELQYIYLLCLIKSTINTFNRRLKYFFSEAPLSFRSPAAVRTNTIHLFRVYVSLCDLLADFNNDEGAIVLCFTLFHISNITSKIRTYFTNYVPDPTDIFFWVKLLIAIYECMRFIVFVEACHRVKVERKTRLVASQLPNQFYDSLPATDALSTDRCERHRMGARQRLYSGPVDLGLTKNHSNDVRHLLSELSATLRGAHAHLKCFEMNLLLHDPVISPLGLFDIIRTFIQMVLGGIVVLVTFLILIHDGDV